MNKSYLNITDIRKIFIEKYKNSDFVIDKTGVKTIEIIGNSFIADEDYIIRKPSYEYIKREIEWYKTMSLYVDDIPGETPKIWKDVSDKNGKINSNYGWCIFSEENGSQYNYVLNELSKNPNSRRAAMIYNRPSMHTDFNKNGMNDFLCFPADTLVLSPEGDLSIKDLVQKINDQGKYPVYSVNFQTNEREISYAVKGSKTGKKEIIRIHFDNGKYIDTTKDHIFFVRERIHNGKQYYYTYNNEVKAEDLKPGMSMVKSLIYKNGSSHLRFKKSLRGEYSYKNSEIVHREYYKFLHPFEDINDFEIHHINENGIDNRSINLIKISKSDHISLHQKGNKNSVFKIKDRKEQIQKMVKTLKNTILKRNLSWYENKYNITIDDILKDLALYAEKNNPTLYGYCNYCKNNKRKSYFTILCHYLKLENLSFNDVVIQNCKVTYIEYLNEIKDVYDIEVQNNHNFFVGWYDEISETGNGVLVHNCTYSNTFFIRNNELISHYIMRSNDVVFGYCNDYAWAKYVQTLLYKDLQKTYSDLKLGNIYWSASSLHLYERHFKFLENLNDNIL